MSFQEQHCSWFVKLFQHCSWFAEKSIPQIFLFPSYSALVPKGVTMYQKQNWQVEGASLPIVEGRGKKYHIVDCKRNCRRVWVATTQYNPFVPLHPRPPTNTLWSGGGAESLLQNGRRTLALFTSFSLPLSLPLSLSCYLVHDTQRHGQRGGTLVCLGCAALYKVWNLFYRYLFGFRGLVLGV